MACIIRSLLIAGLFIVARADAQPGSPDPNADSLFFTVKHVCHDSSKGTICRQDVKGELVYDFEYQYPYYQVKKKVWRPGDQLQLEFSKLPSKGTIYVFSLDGQNTPVMKPLIRMDNPGSLPLTYPDPVNSIQLEFEGSHYIGIWYCSDSLASAERLIRGIEFTIGSIIKRNNRQLNKYLLLPNYGWHFTRDSFGFIMDPDLYSFPEKFVAPVVVELNVVAKRPKRAARTTE